MHLFKHSNKNILTLYNKIVFLTRKNFLYSEFGLTDSFTNRIYLIFFHLSFILTKIKKEGNKSLVSQQIFDFFFRHIEINCRELGYGDTTINKKMKGLIKLFYEILLKCEVWKKLKNNKKNELLEKFFVEDIDNKILTSKLANYFEKFHFFIENIPLNLLIKGVFKFEYKD